MSDGASLPLSLEVGDLIVYASHGIGCVEHRVCGGERGETIVLQLASGLRVTLPVSVAHSALRPLSSEDELGEVQRTLRADAAPDVGVWSRRFRAIREKVTAGRVAGLAEVVRDELRREQRRAGRTTAPSERRLYLRARELLAAEIALVRGIAVDEADGWIGDQVGTRRPDGPRPAAEGGPTDLLQEA